MKRAGFLTGVSIGTVVGIYVGGVIDIIVVAWQVFGGDHVA